MRYLYALYAFVALSIFSPVLVAQTTANVQIVHNSAAASTTPVDIFVNSLTVPTLTNLRFSSAISASLPANTNTTLRIAPRATTGFLATATVNFPAGNHLIVASGALSGVIPVGTGFNVFVQTNVRTAAMNPNNVDLLVFHGVTDAPAVDIYVRGFSTPLVSNLAFGRFSGYASVPAGDYILDVRATGSAATSTPVASFNAPLSTSAGRALTVMASGFLVPTTPTTPRFGLLVVGSDNSTMMLPLATNVPASAAAQTAAVQVIHNAAGANLPVDVIANVINPLGMSPSVVGRGVGFRAAATAPIPVLTNSFSVPPSLVLGIAPANSPQPVFTARFSPSLPAGNFAAIATGELTPAQANRAFTVSVNPTRTAAISRAMVDVAVFHGVTDAPSVDIYVRGIQTPLTSNLMYGEFRGYASIAPGDYTLDIRPAGASVLETPVASFRADLRANGGGAMILLASGYLRPAAGAPAFGLLAVTPDNAASLLPAATSAFMPFIPPFRPSSASAAQNDEAVVIAQMPSSVAVSTFPNPVQERVVVSYTLSDAASVNIMITDNLGRLVSTLDEGNRSAGNYEREINTQEWAAGIYNVSVRLGANVITRRLSVVK
jgi:hypothetical protein